MPLIVEREILRPLCYKCGRLADRVVEIFLPCPWCTVDVPIHLCSDCARKLAEALLDALERLEKAE